MDKSNIYTVIRRNKTYIYYKPSEEEYYGDDDTDNESDNKTDTDTNTDNNSIDIEPYSYQYSADEESADEESTEEESIEEESIEDTKELFKDNLECIDGCNCMDLDIVEDDYMDYEIINESKCVPIKNRYRKQTWYEYFRKLYMVSVILIISIVVYFYYSYSKRRENVVSKL